MTIWHCMGIALCIVVLLICDPGGAFSEIECEKYKRIHEDE